MQIIGEAALRVGAITKDLKRLLQKDVDDALSGIKAPSKNALTDLQRELNKGELDLAKAHEAAAEAKQKVKLADEALSKVRKDSTATTKQVNDAEKAHARALLESKVAIDKVSSSEEKQGRIRERMRTINLGAERDNNTLRRSLSGVLGGVQGLLGGLLKAGAGGAKLALIGTAAGAALAGVTSLGLGVGSLVGVLAQASGVAGLLPAAFAGYLAVSATVKIATQNIGDAFSALASGDAAAIKEAMDKLSPSARAFVGEVDKVRPAFDAMKLNVQERAFAGLSESIGGLAERYLPIVGDLLGGIADSLNAMGREAINFAMSSQALEGTTLLTGNLKAAFANLVPAIQPVMSAILDVTSVGSTFLPGLTAGIGEAAQKFGAWIREMAASGELQAFFERAIETVKTLGRIIGNVFSGLGGVMRAAQASGGGLLANVEQLTQKFSDFINSATGQSALTSFFTAMRAIMAAILPVIMVLVQVIGTNLAPILAQLASIIGPILGPVLQALGGLLTALAPLIQNLAVAFGSILRALGPVIDIFAEAVTAVMPQLTPVIADIANVIVQLIEAATPLIPLFLQLVAALLPILPPILELISALLPPLIQIITALMPVISALVAAFTAVMPVITMVAQIIAAVLIPPIQLIAIVITAVVTAGIAVFQALLAAVSAIFTAIGAAISAAWNAIKTAFTVAVTAVKDAAVNGFNAVKNAISTAMRAIGTAVSTGVSAVINFFKSLPGKILSALGDFGSMLLNVGKNIIDGLLRGLKNAAGAVINFFKNLISDAVGGVLDFLGIGSPSKLFAGIGMDIGRGLVVGLRNVTPVVTAAAEKMVATATKSASGQVLLNPVLDNGIAQRIASAAPFVPLAPGTNGESGEPLTAEDITEAVVAGMEQVHVVLSDHEVTNRVNRVNANNGRR